MSPETDEESVTADTDEADKVDDTDEVDDTSDAPASSATDTSTNSATVEEGSGPSQHGRAIIVTSGATLLGILAGIVSAFVATDGGDPSSTFGFAILLAAVIVQFPLYKLFGMETDSFETKDQLYVFAMTFILWFVTWSIVLTTGALQ